MEADSYEKFSKHGEIELLIAQWNSLRKARRDEMSIYEVVAELYRKTIEILSEEFLDIYSELQYEAAVEMARNLLSLITTPSFDYTDSSEMNIKSLLISPQYSALSDKLKDLLLTIRRFQSDLITQPRERSDFADYNADNSQNLLTDWRRYVNGEDTDSKGERIQWEQLLHKTKTLLIEDYMKRFQWASSPTAQKVVDSLFRIIDGGIYISDSRDQVSLDEFLEKSAQYKWISRAMRLILIEYSKVKLN